MTTAKLDNNAKNKDFKQLDETLQKRRMILEARKITSEYWLNGSNPGATTTQINRAINGSLDIGRTEGAIKEVNKAIEAILDQQWSNEVKTILDQRDNTRPSASNKNNTLTGTLSTTTRRNDTTKTKECTKRTTRCRKCEKCLRDNCGTCKNCSRMTKVGGDGIYKKACKGCKCKKIETQPPASRSGPRTRTTTRPTTTMPSRWPKLKPRHPGKVERNAEPYRPNPRVLQSGGDEEGHEPSRRHQESQPRGNFVSRATLRARDFEEIETDANSID